MEEKKHPPRKVPEAPVPKDPEMEGLVSEAFSSFHPQISYSVDEVVITINPEQVVEACRLAKEDERLQFDYLRCLSVVDYEEHFQVVYHLYSTTRGHNMVIKTQLSKDAPEVPSITGVWRGADWHEREGADLFGVTFTGHPNPKELLLFDEFKGVYPMRKDYPFAEIDEWQGERW